MMSSRRLAVLLPAGIVVIALALWLTARGSRESAPETGGKALFPGLTSELNSVSEVHLAKGDGTRTTLRKGTDSWSVQERGFPADSGRVRKLLLDIASLQIVEDKTSDPANYPQIGVEDVSSPKASGTRIDLVEPGRTRSLIVGKSSGTKSSYVRVASDAQSWLASPQLSVDSDPRRWLDNAVFDLPETRVKDVAVEPASGPAYTVSRASEKQSDFEVSPLPKGRELASPGIANPVASALSSLTLDDVRKAGADAAPAGDASSTAKGTAGAARSPRATFHTFNGLTVTVAGRQDGDHHYIRINGKASTPDTQSEAKQLERFADWELEIPGYKYDSLFRPQEELLKKPEAAKTKDSGPSSTAGTAVGAHPTKAASRHSKPPSGSTAGPTGGSGGRSSSAASSSASP